jgi:hypothetical protein
VDNRALIEQLAVAFRDADFGAFQQGLAPDTELVLAGESRLAGRYVGVGQVLGLIAKLHRMVRPGSLELNALNDTPAGLEIELTLAIEGLQGLAEQHLVDEVAFASDGRVQVSRLRAAGSQQELDRLLDAHLDVV